MTVGRRMKKCIKRKLMLGIAIALSYAWAGMANAQDGAHSGCSHGNEEVEPVVAAPVEETHDEHEEHSEAAEAHDDVDAHEEHEDDHDKDEEAHGAHESHDEDEHEAHGEEEAVDAHAGHGHEEGGGGLELTDEQIQRFGIVVKAAGPGSLGNELRLRGEVVANDNLVAQIPARIPGIVSAVLANIGDLVSAGEVLVVLDSRELADAKAEYLAALAAFQLAESSFNREQGLRDKQISSEQELQEVQQEFMTAQIGLRLAKQKLYALGCAENELPTLDDQDAAITRYVIRSPMAGVVVSREVTKGQSVDGSESLFVVADLSQVWVALAIYVKDMSAIHKGDVVEITAERDRISGQGTVESVTPFVSEATRTATARVVLDNAAGIWQPGTFVTGYLRKAGENLPIVVELDAVQTIEGQNVVFIQDGVDFETVPVVIGRKDRHSVEIVDGLKVGDTYVAEGAYRLKSTMITSTLDSHAGHGH